jgi:peptide maturation system protein (TIGR04066 family)
MCQLGSKGYSNMFGFNTMPDFLYSNNYSLEEKVFLFNRYIYDLQKQENPDLFIIGVPGGIMPFDNKATNYFAAIPYIVGNAINADAVILNVYYNKFTDKYFEELYNYCKYRFGFNVSCFNVANTNYRLNSEDIKNYVNYLSLNTDYIMKNIHEFKNSQWGIYHSMDENSNYAMCNHVYDVLAGNVSMLIYS